MATKIIMPQIGQHSTEGRLVKWLKSEGDPVKKGEPICEVETEKVVFEVESPIDGVLLKIVVQEGLKTEISSVIGIVGALDEQVDIDQFLAQKEKEEKTVDIYEIRERPGEKEIRAAGRIKASGRARKLAEQKGIDLSTIEGSGPGGRIVEEDVLRAAGAMGGAEVAEAVPSAGAEKMVRISPVARKMAEESGINPAAIKGTGTSGRIIKEDVIQAIDQRKQQEKIAAEVPATAFKEVKEVLAIRGVRQVIFERMHQSLQKTAQLTLTMEVDASEFIQFRNILVDRLRGEDSRISYNAILVKILAQALEEHPGINASVVKDEIWLWESVNLGVAMDIDDGLVVPVIRDANKKDLKAIQKEMDTFVEKTRSKKLVPDDLQGGTFTLTNLGFLDIEAFTPILNPPETGILGAGKIIEKPVLKNGEIKVGQRMMLSFTFDHRIVDGTDGARFLKKIKSYIEGPYLLMAGKNH